MRHAEIKVHLSATGEGYRLGTLHYEETLEPNQVLGHLAKVLRVLADDLEKNWIVPDFPPEDL